MPMKKQHGFSMVEVLISLLILLLGVLGMMGLQAQSVNNSELAHYGSIAEIQATSVAAAMRANPAYWGGRSLNIICQPSAVPGTPVCAGGPTPYLLGCGFGTGCTSDQMAYTDIITLGGNIAGNGPGSLPAGNLEIDCDAGVSPIVCQVIVSWSEKNISLNAATGTETGQFATGTVQYAAGANPNANNTNPIPRAQYQILVSIL